MNLGAPGDGIMTTYPGGLYALVWGTSFSVGWVSGGVGLFLERKPTLTTSDVDAAFLKGTTPMSPSEGMGSGRLDLGKATLAVPIR